MKNATLQVTFLTSNKSGIRSKISVKGGKFGLVYRSNQSEKIDNDRTRMIVSFSGNLNCTKEEYIAAMESLSEIHEVERITLGEDSNNNSSSSSDETADDKTNSSKASGNGVTTLLANNVISSESLEIAEAKLLNMLGPIAPLVIKSAASKTKFIGELYLLLAEDLEGKDRQDFLALVSDLDQLK